MKKKKNIVKRDDRKKERTIQKKVELEKQKESKPIDAGIKTGEVKLKENEEEKINKKEDNKRKDKEENKKEEQIKKKIENKKNKSSSIVKKILIALVSGILISGVSYLFHKTIKTTGIIFGIIFLLVIVSYLIRDKLSHRARIKKMEDVFPDFIELMSSNLRAGMTIDRALLLSSRKEFSPLDEEILLLGKEIVTGREMSSAMIGLADRTNSEKIRKTITVIISGIRSGGNLAVLLEETAVNMRERNFVEKRAASNVLMYIIFIFFAIAVGAPALFALSAVLVHVLDSILGNLPVVEASTNLPINLTKINISSTFITYFAMIFLVVIDILASLLLGLVNKGEEREGLRYTIPLIAISLTTFFTIRTFMANYFTNYFS